MGVGGGGERREFAERYSGGVPFRGEIKPNFKAKYSMQNCSSLCQARPNQTD